MTNKPHLFQSDMTLRVQITPRHKHFRVREIQRLRMENNCEFSAQIFSSCHSFNNRLSSICSLESDCELIISCNFFEPYKPTSSSKHADKPLQYINALNRVCQIMLKQLLLFVLYSFFVEINNFFNRNACIWKYEVKVLTSICQASNEFNSQLFIYGSSNISNQILKRN